MNRILEKEIIDTIKSNKVVRHMGLYVDTYNVLNKAGKEIMSVVVAQDRGLGLLTIRVNGQNIASIEWHAKKTKELQSVFNIVDACVCRVLEQEIEKQIQARIAQAEEDYDAMFLKSMQKTK